MPIPWKRFAEIVEQNHSFILTTHMRADCDAIGSELAMAHALRSLGKHVRILNGDGVPPHIAFIDPAGEVQTLDPEAKPADEGKTDVLMVLDTSAWSQMGPMADIVRASNAVKVVVDHHVGGDDLGAESFTDVNAEATGRLVLEATQALGVSLTPHVATALFAAIATDTGWFRFSSVTAKTYEAASRLVAAGADPTAVFSSLYEQHSFARLHLQGRILTSAQLGIDGRLIYSSVTREDLNQTGAETTDTEDVVNRLLSVRGIEVALLFLELESEKTKVSLRSRTTIDVRAVAERFGGGGHTAAAGVRFAGSLAKAKTAVLDAMREAME